MPKPYLHAGKRVKCYQLSRKRPIVTLRGQAERSLRVTWNVVRVAGTRGKLGGSGLFTSTQ